MRAVMVRQHGGLEALRLRDVDPPHCEAGQVLIRIAACGINHLDLWVRRGVEGHTYPLPLILGSDVSGIIDSVGDGVTQWRAGDEVVVAPGVSCGECAACTDGRDHHCRRYGILGEHLNGGYAELIAVPQRNLVAKPANLTAPEAAALGVAFLTAWEMLVGRAQLQAGEIVLVQAGGSGVGSAAIQIAKLTGASVITTASTDDKLRRAGELGADHLINHTEASVPKGVKTITGGKGVDVVVDHVGEATWRDSLRSLGWRGRLVTCGATTGAKVSVDLRHLFFKSQSLLGSTMGSLQQFRQVIDHAADGALRPVIDRVLPLSDAARAHELLETRQVFGKLVLTP